MLSSGSNKLLHTTTALKGGRPLCNISEIVDFIEIVMITIGNVSERLANFFFQKIADLILNATIIL